MTPHSVLQKYWNYSEFRFSQKNIIDSILTGRDTLALLPTGGGKSICYQVPGLILPGLTIVISPLISLMKDQVDALLRRGISATYLASTLPKGEQLVRIQKVKNNSYTFLYLSPEKFSSTTVQSILQSIKVSLIAVDESHCISLWGKSFRPSYLQLSDAINSLPNRPVIAAFTATATANTKKDIIKKLQLQDPKIFQSSFKRDISIDIVTTTSITEHALQLYAYIKNSSKSGIIYTSSRKETEYLAKRLSLLQPLLHISGVGYYHGGLTTLQRQQTQELFLENKLQLLIATTAFGMGIDKPNIEFVVHYHPPATLEGYFQEIGRAGRGGQHAEALFLFNSTHLHIHSSLQSKNATQASIDRLLLADVLTYIRAPYCRMQSLLQYFGESSVPCHSCDNCREPVLPLQNILISEQQSIQNILRWAKIEATGKNSITELVLNQTQLAYLACLKPTNIEQLQLLPGFGIGWIKQWGQKLLNQEWYNTTEQ